MSALDNVPGLAGYLAAQQQNQSQQAQQIQTVGALQSLQANAQKQQREQAYRAELQGLGPNPSEEQLAGVAAKYGGPDVLLKTMEAAQTKKLQLAQQKELADARLDQQSKFADMMHEYRMSQAKTAEERAAETTRHNGLMEQLQAQNANTNAELKRLGLDIQQSKVDAMAGNQKQRQVQQLGTALERANLPEADAVLRGAEEALTKRPDLAEYLSGAKSYIPDNMLPTDIATGKQAFQKLFNITLKNRSGAAVTPPEFERLKKEFGNGLMNTPEQLKSGLQQARTVMSGHYRAVASGFGADALDAYNQNMRELGGSPLLESGAAPTGPALPPPPPGFKLNK